MRTMTAPSSRPAPRYTSEPDPDRKLELTVARREDVRRLAEFGAPDQVLPPVHGGRQDPRYPATTDLRHVLAILIDLVLHLGTAVVVAFVLAAKQSETAGILAGAGVFFALSIVDRIIVQRLFRATVGKMITGLYVIRDDTGGPPTVWSLTREWFQSIGAVLSGLNG